MYEFSGGDVPYEAGSPVPGDLPATQPDVDIIRNGSEVAQTAFGDGDTAAIVAGDHRGAAHYADGSGEAGPREQRPEGDGQDPGAEVPAAGGTIDTPPPTDPPVLSAESGGDDPFVLGQLDRFDHEQPTDEEKPDIIETHDKIIRDAMERHAEYVDEHLTAAGGYLQLEYENPDQMVRVIIRPGTDETDANSVRTDYLDDATGHWDQHDYVNSADGTIVRDDHDREAVVEGVPRPGAIPLRLAIELTAEQEKRGEDDRDEELALGLMPEVGTEQIAYVKDLVERSEPIIIEFPQLEAVVTGALESPLDLEPDDQLRAAGEFRRSVHRYIARGEETEVGLRQEAHDDPAYGAAMNVYASEYGDTAAVRIEHTSRVDAVLNDRIADAVRELPPEVLESWQVRRTITFDSDGIQLKIGRTISIVAGDEVLETIEQSTVGDALQARLVRNFLRKPLIDRPPRTGQ